MINEVRLADGADALAWDGQAGYVSDGYAKLVLAAGIYLPDLDGLSPTQRLAENGLEAALVIETGVVAENLDAEDALAALLELEPGLFEADLAGIGVGVRSYDGVKAFVITTFK